MKKIFLLIFMFLYIAILSGCQQSSYTISFETNGAQEVAPIELEKGDSITLPTVTKEGYQFVGWFIDQELTQEFYQEITKDLKLYAKWEIIKFNVKFLDHDNTVLKEEVVNYGDNATLPQDPTRVGYTFAGWNNTSTNVKSSLVIKALYDVVTYTVKFQDHDNEPIGDELTIEHGKNAAAPEDPTREGYNFLGWDKDLTNITGDLTVTAQYQIKTYSVVFQNHSGVQIGDAQTIEHGEDATNPTAPIREGYEFTGWNYDFTNVTSDLIVRTTYSLIHYNITYYDDQQPLTHNPSTYNINTATTLAAYNKTGYMFVGWFTDEELTNPIEETSVGMTGQLQVYGKWLDESLTFTVNYQLNGGDWTWQVTDVTNPATGIHLYSNLAQFLMADYYLYLKDNDLLTSSVVASQLRKTTWADFSQDYDDPYAIYNHTSSNTSQNNDGYSQFFYSTASGNAATGEIYTIEGGFFGTEPYKSKYATLIQHTSYLQYYRAYGTQFWGGVSGKSLGGFILDGYLYGTQGPRTGEFLLLRGVVPNTNLGYKISGGELVVVLIDYAPTNYVQGLEFMLASPFKDGHVFAGWYDNDEFNGEAKLYITENVEPAATYYAKWIAFEDIE